jgi:hypothetical protein
MTDPFERPARPWDLYNKKIGRVDSLTAEQRLEICKGCDFFIKATSQCKKCGCIMRSKVTLPNAECPIGKWGQNRKEEEII